MSVQSEITRLANAKTALATAIEGKGVTVPEGTKLDGMAALVEAISAGGGGATEPYIEETYDSSGNLIDAKLYGYTKIRSYAFHLCKALASASFPCVTLIGNSAFYGCTGLALTSLPNSVTIINTYTFYGCTKLALTSLPNSVTIINNSAFDGCTGLALTSLPNSVTTISSRAFYGCTGLTSITFEGTPKSISANAFGNCTNLTTINVPWANGAVANAPWGATNATINYNYTGD